MSYNQEDEEVTINSSNTSISPLSNTSYSPVKNRNNIFSSKYTQMDIENNTNLDEETTSLIVSNSSNSNNYESNSIISYNGYIKWKCFTILSFLSILLSYCIGLLIMNTNDINLRSYNDDKLLMGMISLWPECKDNRLQLWRLISNIFIHADLNHIRSNVMALFLLSFPLEMKQHFYSITPLFIGGIIHSNLVFYYTNPIHIP